VGDLQTLRELPFESEIRACTLALLDNPAFKDSGFEQLPQRVVAEWLKAAEAALETHATTVAVVDMQILLNADGLLPALRQRGYTVIEPGQEAPDEALEGAGETSNTTTTSTPGSTNPR
jgi:hypothetical protein